MKRHVIPLVLATFAPLALAQSVSEQALGNQTIVQEPIVHEMTITSVTGTYAMHTHGIIIRGTGLEAAQTVTIAGLPTIIEEKRCEMLRVRGPAVGEPGIWEVVVTSPQYVATATTEYWPVIQVERTGLIQPSPECSAKPRFQTALKETFAIEVHNGGAGNYWFGLSFEQRLDPMQLLFPLTGYVFWLEEPYEVIGMGAIPPSGIARQEFKLPYHMLGRNVYLQGFTQHFDMFTACGGMCFTNLELLP